MVFEGETHCKADPSSWTSIRHSQSAIANDRSVALSGAIRLPASDGTEGRIRGPVQGCLAAACRMDVYGFNVRAPARYLKHSS